MIDPIKLLIKVASMRATAYHGYNLSMRARSETTIDADKKKELISDIITNTDAAIKSIKEECND